MSHLGLLLVSLILFFRTVRAHDICESHYWSEYDCNRAVLEDNIPCHWNSGKEECQTIICADYSNAYQCNIWHKRFGCDWFTLQQSIYGDIDICHSECLKYVDIVFSIDVSSSVMEQDSNAQDTMDYIITVMSLWWSIQETIISKHFGIYNPNEKLAKTAEYTRFGIIYFAKEAEVYLGLEYGSTLNDYIDRVESLFNGNYFNYLPFSSDDTNIVAAIHETYYVFYNGESYYFNKQGLTTKRLSILITDGEPTCPEFAVSPCNDDYTFDEMFHKGINDESIEFFVALIESETMNLNEENVFECFEQYGGTISPILGYYDLKNAIPGMKTATNLCLKPTNAPTTLPTFKPTEIPTDNPTNEPTCLPTDKPSDTPTPKPTNEPTEKPTDTPTRRPTHWPTKNPTDKPTIYYAPPTQKPTKNVYVQKTQSPTKWWADGWNKNNKPTKKPTESPTEKPNKKDHWWNTNTNSKSKSSGKMHRNSHGGNRR